VTCVVSVVTCSLRPGEQEAELGEAFRAEPLLPVGLEFADDVAHRACGVLAALSERDALEGLVARIVVSLQVAEMSSWPSRRLSACLLMRPRAAWRGTPAAGAFGRI
jgi:hypothetical protein